MVSYLQQLFLAFVFGSLMVLLKLLQRTSANSSKPAVRILRAVLLFGRITRLLPLHELAIYSQLAFGTAISIACFVRQYQGVPVYDRMFITMVAGVNIISVFITLCSYFERLSRPRLFIFSTVVMTVFSIAASTVPRFPRAKSFELERLLAACSSHPVMVASGGAAFAPYKINTHMLYAFSVLVLIVIMIGLWLFLRRLYSFGVDGRLHCNQVEPSKYEVIALGAILLTTMILSCLSLYFIWKLFDLRQLLKEVSGGMVNEDNWGFGQVAAPFSWVPLIVEICYSQLGPY